MLHSESENMMVWAIFRYTTVIATIKLISLSCSELLCQCILFTEIVRGSAPWAIR